MSKARVAFLGCGGFMGEHARRFKRMNDAEVVALGDISQSQLDKFLHDHYSGDSKKPPTFLNAREMYQTVKPDAVVIATPHTLHFQHGMEALDAGCHVFMEKPMVTAAEDGKKLAAKAKEKNKIVVVGYNTPCGAEFNYLREQIRAKTFGKLELVVAYISQDWLRGTRGKWRQDPALSGGGQAYDSGAHLLNSLVWSVESNIAEVFAFIDNFDTKVDINSSINIRFENGVLASIAVSGNSPGAGSFMAFIFDQGRVEIDGWGGGWIKVWGPQGEIKYPPIAGVSQTPDENFIDAILGRAAPRTTPQNGIVQSELMDAIYESARTGKPAKPKRV